LPANIFRAQTSVCATTGGHMEVEMKIRGLM